MCSVFVHDFIYTVRFFFFFKQKTSYEMRISDWSSDVCSSDLLRIDRLVAHQCGWKVLFAHDRIDRTGLGASIAVDADQRIDVQHVGGREAWLHRCRMYAADRKSVV